MQLTFTLKMTTAQVVETSVTVNNNSPIQDYVHPDDQTPPTFDYWVCGRDPSMWPWQYYMLLLIGIYQVLSSKLAILLKPFRSTYSNK